MRFSVSVPVLSEQMTLMQPMVSQATIFLTRAFCRAMRAMLMESEMATMVGRPSGTAATMSTMLSMNTLLMVSKVRGPTARKYTSWMTKMSAANTAPMTVMLLPSLPIFSCRGVCPSPPPCISRAISPNCVKSPTSVTAIFPVPPVTKVPEYTMFSRSATGRLFVFEHGGGVLFHRRRFAGERRFVAHERGAFDQPPVRRDLVARFEVHDVADDEFLLRDVLHDAVAHDFDLDALFDLVQLVERLRAAPFHDDGEYHRDEHGDEDARAFRPVERRNPFLYGVDHVHGDGDRPGAEQEDEHGLGQRLPDPPQEALALRAGKLVPAVLFGVLLHLRGRQPRRPVRIEAGERLFGCLCVILHK